MKPKHVFFVLFLFSLFGLFQGCNNIKCDHKEQKETQYYAGTLIYFSYADSAMKAINLKHMKKDSILMEGSFMMDQTIPIIVAMDKGETVEVRSAGMEVEIIPQEDHEKFIGVDIKVDSESDEESVAGTPCTNGQTRMIRGTVRNHEGELVRDSVIAYDVRRPEIFVNTNENGEFAIELLLDAECWCMLGLKYLEEDVVRMSFRSNNLTDVPVDVWITDTHHELRGLRHSLQRIPMWRDSR